MPASRQRHQPAADGSAAEFDALYTARYGDVVAMVYALCGSIADAQDLAQEAFCRTWQRWDRVARYEDPMAWVRRVAVNLTTSRWRRLGVARRHVHGERPTPVPALEPDHVVLVAALRTLPADQRRAIVLHHLVDLPVVEVAHEMGVGTSTVKSWLRRGRAALATELTESGPPDLHERLTANGQATDRQASDGEVTDRA